MGRGKGRVPAHPREKRAAAAGYGSAFAWHEGSIGMCEHVRALLCEQSGFVGAGRVDTIHHIVYMCIIHTEGECDSKPNAPSAAEA